MEKQLKPNKQGEAPDSKRGAKIFLKAQVHSRGKEACPVQN